MKLNLDVWFFVVFGVVFLLYPAHWAFADDVTYNINNCNYVNQDKPYGYCVTKTQGSSSPDILYFLHGAGGYERSWIESKQAIWQYWHDQGIQAPTVVAVSFGPIWLLAEKNQAKASGLFEFLVKDLMPRIETKLGGLKGRRFLVGESMGGYNATQLVMKRPDLFTRTAILCPDITSLTPYSTMDKIREYMSETGANLKLTFWEIVMDRIFYPDDETWNQSAPLNLGQKALGPATPPLYVSGGSEDQFGFFRGDEAFAALARAKGVSMIWDPSDGKHCSFDPVKVAHFVTE